MSGTSYGWIAAGVGLGTLVILIGRRPRRGVPDAPERRTPLGWYVLGLGAAAFALALAAEASFDFPGALLHLALMTAVATLVAGVAALAKWDRRWPTWAGLVLAVFPSLPLPMFGLGYVPAATIGCAGEIRDIASELAPLPGMDVELQGDGSGSCWADVPTNVNAGQLVAHYQEQVRRARLAGSQRPRGRRLLRRGPRARRDLR